MNEWSVDKWESAVRAVFRKSIEDPKFRKLALENPVGAMAEAIGEPVPSGLKFRFVERPEETVLVLPRADIGQDALSEIDVSRILYHAFRGQSVPPAFSEESES